MNYKEIQEVEQADMYISQGDMREPIYNAYGEQMCMMCRNANSGNFNGAGVMLCIPCADLIVNVYSYERFGKFLTWETGIQESKSLSVRNKKAVITQTLRTQVFERDEYRCKGCGTHKNLAADHIHPESKGGETLFDNLQTLCQSCNSSKGTKTMGEWVGGVK